MLRIICWAVLAGALLLPATEAAAQTSRPLNLKPEQYPRWDLGGGVGLFYLRSLDSESSGNWDLHGDVRFDLGRYWTTHIKTELGVSVPHTWTDYRAVTFRAPGFPSGAYTFTEVDRRLTTLSPAATYQFLENTFAHPYVSTGVRLGMVETHAHRSERTFTQVGLSDTVPALDERSTSLRVAPFVAGGFKSYFSDRVFLRSEALVALRSRGADQMTFRLAFGFDF
jgi:hypothetical protein